MKKISILAALAMTAYCGACVDYNPATGNYNVDQYGLQVDPNKLTPILEKAPHDIDRPRLWAEDDHQLHAPMMFDRMLR